MSATYDPTENNREQSLSLFGNGLDESDVLLFINSLMEQTSELVDKLEQAESLIKLAMEGVHDDTARQVESARAEADKIIAEAKKIAESNARENVSSAEQQAQDMLKAAQEKVESIIRTAEDEASRKIHEARQKAEATRWQAKEILDTAQYKAKSIISQAEEDSSKTIIEAKNKAEKEALLIKQEAEQILEKNKAADNKGELKETIAAILSQLKDHGVKQPAQESAQDDMDKKERFALYNGSVELEIPPPISMGPLKDLAKYLKNTRQIEVLALNSTSNHGLRIRIFIHKPLPLIHILKSLPQVEKVSRESRRSQGKQPSHSQSGNGSILVKMRN